MQLSLIIEWHIYFQTPARLSIIYVMKLNGMRWDLDVLLGKISHACCSWTIDKLVANYIETDRRQYLLPNYMIYKKI